MTEAAGVLTRLGDLGVVARADGQVLRLRPASSVPPDLLAEVREHKAELLALLAEPDPLPSPKRAQLNRDDAGLMIAALRRPPAWSPATALPSPGSRCSCCGRGRWWCETVAPSGWRCRTCHPPDHLPADQAREVVT